MSQCSAVSVGVSLSETKMGYAACLAGFLPYGFCTAL